LLDRINPAIEELTAAVEREAGKRPEVLRVMTHPGVGPLTALAYALINHSAVGQCASRRVFVGRYRAALWPLGFVAFFRLRDFDIGAVSDYAFRSNKSVVPDKRERVYQAQPFARRH